MSARPPARQDAGAVAVEFAVIVPVFLLLLLAVIDGGRALFVQTSLMQAAGQGARAAALNLPAGEVATVAQQSAPGIVGMAASSQGAIDVSVDASCPQPLDPAVASMSAVTTSVEFYWFTPVALLQWFDPSASRPGSVTLSANAEWLCVPVD